jgi:tetratricopeptide (TPR) repeat protein
MAQDPRRRQRKLVRKAAKRKTRRSANDKQRAQTGRPPEAAAPTDHPLWSKPGPAGYLRVKDDQWAYVPQPPEPEGPAPSADSVLAGLGYRVTRKALNDPEYLRLPEPVRSRLHALQTGGMQEDPQAAIDFLEPLIAQYPRVRQLYNVLQTAYLTLGATDQADRILDETLTLFPDYLFARVGKAIEHLKAGEPDRVDELLGPAHDLHALYPEREVFHAAEVMGFHFVLGWYFVLKEDQSRARACHAILEVLDPGHHETTLIGELLIHPSPLERLREPPFTLPGDR